MIEIIETIRRMDQGATEPYLCKADDGKQYVIKGASANGLGCAHEWVIGSLGKSIGLPIPDFKLALINEELLEYDKDLKEHVGTGTVFASEYVPHLQEITYADLESREDDKELLFKLFVFDYWVRNEDRCLTEKGGNPNLFIDQGNNLIVVLDHNLGFDPDFDMESFCKLHVGVNSWKQLKNLYMKFEMSKDISCALKKLDTITNQLPIDWFSLSTKKCDFVDDVKLVLSLYEEDSFWEAIK